MPNTLKPRALLTGATGFVGSRLAHYLIAEGWEVTGLVRPHSKLDQLKPRPDIPVKILELDGNIDTFFAQVRNAKPDAVFHLASLFLAQHMPHEVAPMIQANLTLGTELLEAMSAAGITRFINVGTGWQHYNNAPYRPVNLYAATKQAFEDILAYYCDAHALRAITLKIFDSYGPDDPRPKLISALMRAAREQKALELSPGEQQLELVHIDDICNAFTIAATRTATLPAGTHERYALTAAHRITLRQLVEQMKTALNTDIPVKFGAKPYRPREVMVPWTNGTRLPGWSPQVPLAEGIRACFDTFKARA
jgi:nucleoside-diphosphate-sugar epimerase